MKYDKNILSALAKLKLSARKDSFLSQFNFRYRDISDNEKSIAKGNRGPVSEEKCGSSDTYCTSS